MEQKKRYLSLDVFRGITVAMMILVNNPGSWQYIYAPLKHSHWNGCTPTDLVAPFFLIAVGLSMAFAFSKFNYKLNKEAAVKIVKRSVLIFAIGLFLASFPQWKINFSELRIMGILQRIALAYLFGSFIVLSTGKKWLPAVSAVLLLAYWAILYFGGSADPYSMEGNAGLKLDLFVLGSSHLYQGDGIPFDPEGLLGTISSTVTVLLGFQLGSFIKNHQKGNLTLQLAGIGLIGIALGLIWNTIFPINKALWTSSYVLYSAGIAAAFLGLLIWIIDVNKKTRWTNPFVVFGMNPLFLYAFSWILSIAAETLITVRSGDKILGFEGWAYESVLSPTFGPYNGSLIYAVAFVAISWLIGFILYKRKIFVKV